MMSSPQGSDASEGREENKHDKDHHEYAEGSELGELRKSLSESHQHYYGGGDRYATGRKKHMRRCANEIQKSY